MYRVYLYQDRFLCIQQQLTMLEILCACYPTCPQPRRFTQRMRSYTYSVESVVNEMFDVLTHSDLSHKLVLVSVHSSQLANMGKDVLKAIGKLYDTK